MNARKYIIHRFFLISVIFTATYTDKTPTKPLENRLTFHVLANFFFTAVKSFAITFYCHLV